MTQPKNARTQKGRLYVWPPRPDEDGNYELEVPNVTGVISGGIPKPFLKAWGQRLVAEFAFDNAHKWERMDRDEAVDYLKGAPWRMTKGKADIGTEVHDAIEARIEGRNVPEMSPTAERYFDGYLRFESDFSPSYEYVEATCYSREHGYAGTGDAIGYLGAMPDLGRCIIDWKTSKAIYDTHALQLVGLARADFIGLQDHEKHWEEPVGEIETGIIVRFTEHGEYEVKGCAIDDAVWESFLAAKRVAHWARNIAPTVLSDPLIPEGAAPHPAAIKSNATRAAVEYVRDNEPCTLADIVEGLDISERAAKMRLRKAVKRYGLVAWDKDAEVFRYVDDSDF